MSLSFANPALSQARKNLSDGKSEISLKILNEMQATDSVQIAEQTLLLVMTNYQLGDWKAVAFLEKVLPTKYASEEVRYRIEKMMAVAKSNLGKPAIEMKKKYGLAGCGLGSIVGESDGPQTQVMTLNVAGSQSFAISSGTSNCTSSEKKSEELSVFYQLHSEKLTWESLKKEKPYTLALSELYGCNRTNQIEFSNVISKWVKGGIKTQNTTIRSQLEPWLFTNCEVQK